MTLCDAPAVLVEAVTMTRTRGVVNGWTYEARLSARGYLHIVGPLEHKRPRRAMYDLKTAEVCDWPDFTGRTEASTIRRRRFNAAAWALIAAVEGESEDDA